MVSGPDSPDIQRGWIRPITNEATMTQIAVVEELKQLFDAEKLPLPPVPERLLRALKATSPQSWSTRTDDSAPQDIDRRIDEATSGIADYAEIGFSGHGVNSWLLHCNLSIESLTLLVQCRWGNAYDDAQRARQRIEGVTTLIGRLLDEIGEARTIGALPGNERLVVCFSDHYPSRWQWRSDPEVWHQDGDFTLIAALAAVSQRIKLAGK